MADQNSRTREDTYGIRPDLFDALRNTKAAQAQSLFEALSGKSADAAKVTADLERLNSQLQAHGEAAPGGLIPAYIDANTHRWELQEQVDAAQDMLLSSTSQQVSDMMAQFRDIQQQLTQEKTVSMVTPYNSSWARENAWASVNRITGSGWHQFALTSKGTWSGTVKVVLATRAKIDAGTQIITTEYSIPRPDGSRTFTTAGYSYLDSADTTITVNPGVQNTRDKLTGPFNPSSVSTWVAIPEHSFTPPQITAENYLLFWRVKWNATTYNDFYGIRITQGSTVIKTQTLDKFGPLLPIMPGDREQWIRVPAAKLVADVPVQFEVYSSAPDGGHRAIGWAETNMSWIE